MIVSLVLTEAVRDFFLNVSRVFIQRSKTLNQQYFVSNVNTGMPVLNYFD